MAGAHGVGWQGRERPADAAPTEPEGRVTGRSAEDPSLASVRCGDGMGRHYLDPSVAQKTEKSAVAKAGVAKAASCRSFRHSFATHLLERA